MSLLNNRGSNFGNGRNLGKRKRLQVADLGDDGAFWALLRALCENGRIIKLVIDIYDGPSETWGD